MFYVNLNILLLQVLIKVYICGVNLVEIYIRFGIYNIKLVLFYIFGLDVVGVVEVVGDNVFVFKVLYFQLFLFWFNIFF